MRKMRTLGLTLAVSLVFTVFVVSAAEALEFHSSAENTTVSGSQVGSHEFTTGSGFGSIKCKTAEFSGTVKLKTEASQLITPVYKECTDSLGRIVHVTVNAKYRFTPPVAATGEAKMHVEGELTRSITSSGKQVCHVQFKSQTDGGITFHNAINSVTGKKHLLVTTSTSNIISTTTGGFFNCGIADGEHTGGTYNGTTTLSGTAGGVPVDIWVE